MPRLAAGLESSVVERAGGDAVCPWPWWLLALEGGLVPINAPLLNVSRRLFPARARRACPRPAAPRNGAPSVRCTRFGAFSPSALPCAVGLK